MLPSSSGLGWRRKRWPVMPPFIGEGACGVLGSLTWPIRGNGASLSKTVGLSPGREQGCLRHEDSLCQERERLPHPAVHPGANSRHMSRQVTVWTRG